MPEYDERKKQELEKIIEVYKEKKAIPEDELLNRMDRIQLDVKELDEVYDYLAKKGIKVINVEEQGKINDQMLQKIMSEVNIDDSVKMYLKDIGRVPLLSAQEELELAEKMSQGDDEAKKQLINANLRLGVSIAK